MIWPTDWKAPSRDNPRTSIEDLKRRPRLTRNVVREAARRTRSATNLAWEGRLVIEEKPFGMFAFERHAKDQLIDRVQLDEFGPGNRWLQTRARPANPPSGGGLLGDARTVVW